MKQTALAIAVHGPLHCLGWILFAILLLNAVKKADASSYVNPSPEGESWAPCGFAAEQLAAEGNGSTYGSCLACDPTNFECPPKCQPLIDAMYKQCDGVYAPQDQYFDPAHTLNGYWNDNFGVLREQAARCGCSDAARTWLQQWFLAQLAFAAVMMAQALTC
ncbi:hypothetical protein L915_21376 [Phytophthora nicotianae]|uniref:Uncharacterized protein n=1 Tax=Phytophthora nicotianae TaxID=4792 RepID=W2HSA7_PHYNI|nr:hypothetical protein L915_21376 [Phytophthora nicotianae]ETL24815.1 hypothetical protein L916_21246 [Phytophthora nicotianae]ETM31302.1 hypothetical protein L914_21108 [Phytophthora nicotianae]